LSLGRGLTGVGLYWLTVLMLMPIACAWVASEAGFSLGGVVLTLAILFPAVQLVASLIAALLVLFWRPEHRGTRWRTIGRISWYSFVGMFLGILLMCLLFLLGTVRLRSN